MMTIAAEISAAPHFPHSMRSAIEPVNALSVFVGALEGVSEIEVIEENGELRLVCHPITAE
ncbi:MAG: hypothetical protein KDJ17_02170 [Hyphomicrobiaceae bacterium]|nr:hypothetical protein [Hyphomicrobiaceae bacterium]